MEELRELLQKDTTLAGVRQAFIHMQEAFASPDEETAKERLATWFENDQWSTVPAVRSIAKTLQSRKEALLSAC